MNRFVLLTLLVGFVSSDKRLKCCQTSHLKPKTLRFVEEDVAKACESQEHDDCQACAIAYDIKTGQFLQHCVKEKDDKMLESFDDDMDNMSKGKNRCRYHDQTKALYEAGLAVENPVVICTCDGKDECNKDVITPKEMDLHVKKPFKFEWAHGFA